MTKEEFCFDVGYGKLSKVKTFSLVRSTKDKELLNSTRQEGPLNGPFKDVNYKQYKESLSLSSLTVIETSLTTSQGSPPTSQFSEVSAN